MKLIVVPLLLVVAAFLQGTSANKIVKGNGPGTYFDAFSYCMNKGMKMVEINSEEDVSNVISAMEDMDIHKAWVGIRRRDDNCKKSDSPGSWNWLNEYSGAPLANGNKNPFWKKGEPNNKAPRGKQEACVEFVIPTKHNTDNMLRLNDLTCDEAREVICQTKC